MKDVLRITAVITGAILLSPIGAHADSRSEALEEIDAMTAKIEEIKAGNSGTFQLQENINKLEDEMELMKLEVTEMETQILELEYLLSVYKGAYRVVSKASAGTPLGNITLKNGTLLQNAMFSGTARGGIQVATAGGVATVPADQIPAVHADKFNLPGAIPDPTSNANALAATRPGEVLGVSVAEAEEEEKSKKKKKKSTSSDGMTPDERAQAYLEAEKRNEQRWDQISVLRDEAKRNYAQRKGIILERRRKKEDFDSQRIKPDRNMVDSVLGGYDKQLENIEKRDKEISDQIRALRNAIE